MASSASVCHRRGGQKYALKANQNTTYERGSIPNDYIGNDLENYLTHR